VFGRLLKTLTREGAIRTLVGMVKEAVREGLVEGGGVKVVGSECMPGETGPLVDSVIVSISSNNRGELDHRHLDLSAVCISNQDCSVICWRDGLRWSHCPRSFLRYYSIVQRFHAASRMQSSSRLAKALVPLFFRPSLSSLHG
jgi:hypothetical protein